MICAFSEGQRYPCGQCFPCRLNKQRKWLLRLLCEGTQHSQPPLFVTLTYKDAPLCQSSDGLPFETLRPDDLKAWLQLLRRRVVANTPGLTSDTPLAQVVRYYACGEYGTLSGRPHYHAILFGDTARISALLEKSWSHGFVTQRWANSVNMAYTLKYVLKGIGLLAETNQQIPFSRMSRRPPLGTGFALNIARSFMPLMARDNSPAMEDFLGCLPPILQIDGKFLPLDRTMKNAVRDAMVSEGMPEHLLDLVFPSQEIEFDAEKTKKSQAAHYKAHRNRKKTTLYAV